MRKWGILISLLYAGILMVVLIPSASLLFKAPESWHKFVGELRDAYGEPVLWILIAVVLASQASLLFLSVDTSHKRLKPRAHIAISSAVAGALTALLFSAMIWSVGFAARGDDFWSRLFDHEINIFLFWGALWLFWGVVFFMYLRNSSDAVACVVSWLLRGSVLELLIAVPCHVIVRRRHDCSAPLVTSFGIVTGIAIMLLAFGPSVFFLYKKRLDSYQTAKTP